MRCAVGPSFCCFSSSPRSPSQRPSFAQRRADVVLRPGSGATVSGAWTVVADAAAAGGTAVRHANAGAAKLTQALAQPVNYFEQTFVADAGVPYRLWLRGRAQSDGWANDSVFVQFSTASTAAAPRGTASARPPPSKSISKTVRVAAWPGGDGRTPAGAWACWAPRWCSHPRARSGSGSRPARTDSPSIRSCSRRSDTSHRARGAQERHHDRADRRPGPGVTVVRRPYLQQMTSNRVVVVWATRESGVPKVRVAAGSTTRTVTGASRLVPNSRSGLGFDYYHHEVAVGGLVGGDRLHLRRDRERRAGGLREFPHRAGDRHRRYRVRRDRRQRHRLDRAAANRVADGRRHLRSGAARRRHRLRQQRRHRRRAAIARSTTGSSTSTRRCCRCARSTPPKATTTAGRRTATASPTWMRSRCRPTGPRRRIRITPSATTASTTAGSTSSRSTPSSRSRTRRAAAEQLSWLESDLAATAQPWKIAVFHRSPYSAGGEHGSDLVVRAHSVRCSSRYGVQLVISAHEHTYERAIPIRDVGDRPGRDLHRHRRRRRSAVSRRHRRLDGVLEPRGITTSRAAVTDCTLTLRAIGLDGSVFDTVVLDRCAHQPPRRPGRGVVCVGSADPRRTMGASKPTRRPPAVTAAASRRRRREARERTGAAGQLLRDDVQRRGRCAVSPVDARQGRSQLLGQRLGVRAVRRHRGRQRRRAVPDRHHHRRRDQHRGLQRLRSFELGLAGQRLGHRRHGSPDPILTAPASSACACRPAKTGWRSIRSCCRRADISPASPAR